MGRVDDPTGAQKEEDKVRAIKSGYSERVEGVYQALMVGRHYADERQQPKRQQLEKQGHLQLVREGKPRALGVA